ncbi:hypothetical protein AV530_009137 [Patagioenas fasciata monilis]|uniref:Uncharacterized protein n=1 Tax=Patagioenas fasciata monilis TaxID=372326 RepID=A0A1V4K560_PATFA|nr:hypothetical protein AV530_009137 [Patagioenas fasciata monilis]
MDLRAGLALWLLCGLLLQPGRAERPPGPHLDETPIAGPGARWWSKPAGLFPPRQRSALQAVSELRQQSFGRQSSRKITLSGVEEQEGWSWVPAQRSHGPVCLYGPFTPQVSPAATLHCLLFLPLTGSFSLIPHVPLVQL